MRNHPPARCVISTERNKMPRHWIEQGLSFRCFKKCKVEVVGDRPEVLHPTFHNHPEPSTQGGTTKDRWIGGSRAPTPSRCSVNCPPGPMPGTISCASSRTRNPSIASIGWPNTTGREKQSKTVSGRSCRDAKKGIAENGPSTVEFTLPLTVIMLASRYQTASSWKPEWLV